MNHVMAVCGRLSMLAAFLAGIAGSVHCLAMCGGVSGALAMRVRRLGVTGTGRLRHTSLYQVGRLSSYAVIGAVSGGLLGGVRRLVDVEALSIAMRIAAGLVLVAAAIGLLSGARPLARIESLGARVWRRLLPLTRRLAPNHVGNSYLLGMLWGWLPCGMVYSMLLVASMSGSAGDGAATMVAFGAGTLPAVVGMEVASERVLALGGVRHVNAVCGWLVLGFGLWTALVPMAMRVS